MRDPGCWMLVSRLTSRLPKGRRALEQFLWSFGLGGSWRCACGDAPQGPLPHLPALELAAEVARPVFLRAGHEDLAPALVGVFQQGQKTGPAVRVQFPHHVVDQE